MSVIMRPVYNRPEMLQLSLEYEEQAREYFTPFDIHETLFIVEHGADDKTLELVDKYKYPKKIIERESKYGLSKNILEGFKIAFNISDDYVIYIEDDVLLHKTYFEYINMVLATLDGKKYSIISPYSPTDVGDVNLVRCDNRYAALAPLISKYFYMNYIFPLSDEQYYVNRSYVCDVLNKQYKDYWENRRYKYSTVMHNEQAGLINRLVDVAIIEEEIYAYLPLINRQRHIGYFGKNRQGGDIPGNNFEERLNNLKNIIDDTDKMIMLSGTPQYKDYLKFSEALEDWDGKIIINGYGGTALTGD